MGYMEGNLVGMDYPYGAGSSQFPLWKPPNGYYPRGEAPPPYEEAISQAETLSAQCTVSVATSTHRSIPLGINPVDIPGSAHYNHQQQHQNQQMHQHQHHQQQQQQQPRNITSTTNLININISNGSNLAAIATGENHQLPYSCLTTVNAGRQQSSSCQSNSSQNLSTNHQQNRIRLTNSSICVPSALPLGSVGPNSQEIAEQRQQAQQNNSNLQQHNNSNIQQQNQQGKSVQITECTYKNCHLKSNLKCAQKPSKEVSQNNINTKPIEQDTYQSTKNDTVDPESSRDKGKYLNLQSSTVDKPGISMSRFNNETSILNNDITTTKHSRNLHRTIPRQFTDVDSSLPTMQTNLNNVSGSTSGNVSSTSALNSSGYSKKPTCQCPVQHVPMSYMGANQISNAQNNNIFLSTLTTKLSNNRSRNTSKSTPNCSSSSSCNSHNKIIAINNILPTSDQNGSSKGSANQSYLNANQSSKISTISRHVGDLKSDLNFIENNNFLDATGNNQKSASSNEKYSSLGAAAIQHKPENTINQDIVRSAGDEMFPNSSPVSSFPIQLIHTSDNNPVLPPKMYKNQLHKVPSTNHIISSKIHTISKPQNALKTSCQLKIPSSSKLSTNNQNSLYAQNSNCKASTRSYNLKSLTRKDEKSNAPPLTLPSTGSFSTEKSQSLGKINSTTFYPMQNSHATYTLPKHINGKVSLNSTINSVVSKVPSVISIPAPIVLENDNFERNNSSHTVNTSKTIVQSKLENNQKHPSQSPTENRKFTTLPPTLKSKNVSIEKSSLIQNSKLANQSKASVLHKPDEKPLPVCTTSKNCSNPKEHFLPNDTSLDDDYLSECENCKTAHGSKYYLDEEILEQPQVTMTLQRKIDEKDEEATYYRISHTLPTNPKKNPTTKNSNREPWFSTIPASSSSEEEIND